MMDCRCIPEAVRDRYEVHDFRHATQILCSTSPAEIEEIFQALMSFRLSVGDILAPGGNESSIPKRIATFLRPRGWHETRIAGDLAIRLTRYGEQTHEEHRIIPDYLDGHKIDFVKNRVAFDLEWNSKDQTFDRDLYAFRAFYEAGVIDAGILLTRSGELNEVFKTLGVMGKYGASTTWMGKLLYRLRANRNGGCPVLVFGITPRLIEDWNA